MKMDPKCLVTLTAILCLLLSPLCAEETEIISFNYDELKHHPVNNQNPVPHASSSRRGRGKDVGSRYLNRRKPNKKHMDSSAMLDLLGADFETTWMSVEKPQSFEPLASNEIIPDDEGDRWAAESLIIQMEEMNLTGELHETELGSDSRIISAIRGWLLKRASCPVEFTWQDLGKTFWPRWVRKGDCTDRHGTCSWPPGMNCVPASTTTVHILRWQCEDKKKKNNHNRDRVSIEVLPLRRNGKERPKIKNNNNNNSNKKKKCRWNRVPLPITIDCFCTC